MVQGLQLVAGRGVEGRVDGRLLRLGSQRWLSECGLDAGSLAAQAAQAAASGQTVSWMFEPGNGGQPTPRLLGLLTFGDEVFINAGREIVYNFFDNNRLMLGPSVQFGKDFSIGLLFNHQFGQRNRPATVESSEILWLTVNQRFGKHRNAP